MADGRHSTWATDGEGRRGVRQAVGGRMWAAGSGQQAEDGECSKRWVAGGR